MEKMNEKEMIELFIHEINLNKVDEFIKNNGIDAVDRDNRTLLYMAISEKKADLAIYLINKGCAINIKDKQNFSPLHFASIYNLYDVADLLIEKGADVNAKDDWGNTPLLKSITGYNKGATDITRLLIENGANIEDKNKYGVSFKDLI